VDVSVKGIFVMQLNKSVDVKLKIFVCKEKKLRFTQVNVHNNKKM